MGIEYVRNCHKSIPNHDFTGYIFSVEDHFCAGRKPCILGDVPVGNVQCRLVPTGADRRGDNPADMWLEL